MNARELRKILVQSRLKIANRSHAEIPRDIVKYSLSEIKNDKIQSFFIISLGMHRFVRVVPDVHFILLFSWTNSSLMRSRS